MAQDVSPVLSIPLPAFAGGGFAQMAIRASKDKPGSVVVVISSAIFSKIATIPAADLIPFVDALDAAIIAAGVAKVGK